MRVPAASGFAAVICAAFLSALQSGCSTTAPSDSNEEVAFEGTAEKLCSEFTLSETAAIETYTNKIAVVNGSVKLMSRDIRGSRRARLGNAGFTQCGVECTFSPADKAAAFLTEGQSVTIRGRLIGKLGDVKMVDCTLQ